MRIRIAWESSLTGFAGHGDWFDQDVKDDLQEFAELADKKHPGIRHWIEEEQPVSHRAKKPVLV